MRPRLARLRRTRRLPRKQLGSASTRERRGRTAALCAGFAGFPQRAHRSRGNLIGDRNDSAGSRPNSSRWPNGSHRAPGRPARRLCWTQIRHVGRSGRTGCRRNSTKRIRQSPNSAGPLSIQDDRSCRVSRIAPPGGGVSGFFIRTECGFGATGPGVVGRWAPGPGGILHLARDQHRVPRSMPGHHLQIGTAGVPEGHAQRLPAVVDEISGRCEGWALYAEQLVRRWVHHFRWPVARYAQLATVPRQVRRHPMHLELEIPGRHRLPRGRHGHRNWSSCF